MPPVRIYLEAGFDETRRGVASILRRSATLGLAGPGFLSVDPNPRSDSDQFFHPTDIAKREVINEFTLATTPRALARHPTTGTVYVVGADGNTMSPETAATIAESSTQPAYIEGAPQRGHRAVGHWASSVQAIDPVTRNTVTCTLWLQDNEAALCCNVVQFRSQNWKNFLIVGIGHNMNTISDFKNIVEDGSIRVYNISEDGETLTFLFKTAVDLPVHALVPFHGLVAVGIGKDLVLYDLGMKAVLRKTLSEVAAHKIVSLEARGDRMVIGDVRESVTYALYQEEENRFLCFADDTIPRAVTSSTMIDYDTSAGGDKFGNLWIVRLPDDISKAIDDPERRPFVISDRAFLNAAPNRLELKAHYFTSDIPTTVQRTPLIANGEDVLYWSGIQGTLGILIPFLSRRDVDFFGKIEAAMRDQWPFVGGRDHLAFRSYYAAVRSVIDGDLCELFSSLTHDGKLKVAAEVDRPVPEIEKKIQEMRTRVAF